MKLNATTEMIPVTWPEFGPLHPFAPLDQAEGYRQLIARPRGRPGRDHRLRRRVAAAQRRLPGRAGRPARHPRLPPQPGRRPPRRVPHPLLGPRHQRRLRGHGRHAGRGRGLRRRRQRRPRRPPGQGRTEHGDRLAALMVTYPSTHGVFEAAIAEICDIVHDHGGQVYVDGANLNALVGRGPAGPVRGRRLPPEPAQDVLHPPRRRRPRRRARWPCGRTWRRSCPATRPRPRPGPDDRARPDLGGARGARPGSCPSRWAYITLMGPDGPAPGHRGGHPHRQLRRRPPGRRTTRCSTRASTAGWPTSASSTCGPSPRPPASPSTTWPSA